MALLQRGILRLSGRKKKALSVIEVSYVGTKAAIFRSSPPGVFLGKSVLKIWRKSTGKHQCRCVIWIKLLCDIIEIALRHGCYPVNLLHISRTPFLKNTYGGLYIPRYVDDSHARFGSRNNANEFLNVLDSQDPQIQYTIEYENEHKELNFLDVTIKDSIFCLYTVYSVYCQQESLQRRTQNLVRWNV